MSGSNLKPPNPSPSAHFELHGPILARNTLRRDRVNRQLDADDGAEFLDGGGAAFEGGVFVGGELDLDDLFETGGTELAGNADVEAFDAVFALEVDGAGKDFLLVLEDGLDHLDGGCGGRVVGAAGFETLDDLGTAITSALDERGKTVLGDQLGDGNASDGGVAGKRHHGVPVSSEDKGGDVFDADLEFFGDEGAEAGRVEYAGHADDALAVEAGLFEGSLGHSVEGVGDDDEDGLGRLGDDFRDHVGHDLVVGVEQVVAAHSGLAGQASGDNNDVGVGGLGIVVGAGDVYVAFFDGHGFEQVESLALWDAFGDVDENDVGEFLGGDPVRGGGANVACAYDADFFTHDSPFHCRSWNLWSI
uniref:Uncharacterized protein n=1 Tax=mine drainage metagenome TaxID=410659 RepID=E6QN76_9ZZZZ